MGSDKDEVWSTPPPPEKSTNVTPNQTQESLPDIVSAKPARTVEKEPRTNKDTFKELSDHVQLLRTTSELIVTDREFYKEIKNEIDDLLAKLDFQIFKGLEAPPSQGVDMSNEQEISIIEHREELEVSKNLIVNIKTVTAGNNTSESETALENTNENVTSLEEQVGAKLDETCGDKKDTVQEEDLEIPANNVVTHQELLTDDEDSLIPETPDKKSKKRKRKPVISDDEESNNEEVSVAEVAIEKEVDSIDSTPIQRTRKKKLINTINDDESDSGLESEKKMEIEDAVIEPPPPDDTSDKNREDVLSPAPADDTEQ